jgi:homoserine kinase type II
MTLMDSPAGLTEFGQPPKVPFPLDDLAAAYDLGQWRSVRWLTAGKNDHVQVSTDRTRFFLRRSHRSKTIEALRWQLDLLAQLRREGLPVPVPIRARGGSRIVVLEDRLYVATCGLPGAPYDPDVPGQLHAAGQALATYHDIVRRLAVPALEADRDTVLDALRERLDQVDTELVPDMAAAGEAAYRRLAELWSQLPVTTMYGGCRRGSLLFTGTRITGLLDFDSARRGIRCLDVAVALHDVGKVYTAFGRDDHKVAMDFARMTEFLGGYRSLAALTPAEAEAIPLIITARRLNRGLGRAKRQQDGEPLSENDLTKISLEVSRLRWLSEHADELRAVCAGG